MAEVRFCVAEAHGGWGFPPSCVPITERRPVPELKVMTPKDRKYEVHILDINEYD